MPVSSFAEAASISQSSATGAQAAEHAADTETAVLRLLNNELNVTVATQNISVAHRLSTKRKTGGDSTGPAPIIVRFTSLKVRDTVYRARLALKGRERNIYINEHLTKEDAKLFHEARQLVKQKRLHSSWTKNGVVYVKKSGDNSSRPLRVNSTLELQNAAL